MKLSAKAIRDSQKAYQKDFNEDISPQEAEQIGSRLTRVMDIIYQSTSGLKRNSGS